MTLTDGNEVDVEYLIFKQLKNEFTTRIDQDNIPKNFLSKIGSQLVIDNDMAMAFWVVKGGVEYMKLEDLAKSVGIIKGGRLAISEEIISLHLLPGKLIVATNTILIYIFDLTQLEKGGSPTSVGFVETSSITVLKDYVCGVNSLGELFCFKLGVNKTEKLKDFINIKSIDASPNNIVAVSSDGKIYNIGLPDGYVSKIIQFPSEVDLDAISSFTIKVINERKYAVGLDNNLYILEILSGDASDRWIEFRDPARGSGEDSRLMFACINGWSEDLETLLIVGDSSSSDVVCGGNSKDSEFNLFFVVSEEGLLQMPLSKLNPPNETFPIAMALDFCNGDNVEMDDPEAEMLPPQPILWVITSDGVFCPFRIVKTNSTINSPLHLLSGKYSCSIKVPKDLKVANTKVGSPSPSDLSSTPNLMESSNISRPESTRTDETDVSIVSPLLEKISEDFGLINNAVVGTFVDLYSSFNDDLDQSRSLAQEQIDLILKNRKTVLGLDNSSSKITDISSKMDKSLNDAITKEKELMELVARISTLNIQAKNNFDDSIPLLVKSMTKTVEKVEQMTIEAQEIQDCKDRMIFLQSNILPELEESLKDLNSLMNPKPNCFSNRPIKRDIFKSALQKLRSRDSHDVVTRVDNVPTKPKPTPARATDPQEVRCRPMPKTTSFQQQVLEPLKSPSRLKEVIKVSQFKPKEINIINTPAVPNAQTAFKPSFSSKESLVKPVSNVLTTAPPMPTIAPTKPLETGTQERKIDLGPAKEAISEKLKSKPLTFSFNPPQSIPTKSESIKEAKAHTEKEKLLSTPSSPVKLHLLDADQIDIKSPTPKGPKSPEERKTEFDNKNETPTLFDFSGLAVTVEKTSSENNSPTKPAVSGVFNLPKAVVEEAPSIPTATLTGSFSSNFGFKPSLLESVAPAPEKITPTFGELPKDNTPHPFGSLQSLGVQGATSSTPTFGAATGFGAFASSQPPSFGQTSAFGFKPPAAPTPTQQSGFANTGFAAFANPQSSGGSIFGAASNAPQKDTDKKGPTNLPPSFTQFRS